MGGWAGVTGETFYELRYLIHPSVWARVSLGSKKNSNQDRIGQCGMSNGGKIFEGLAIDPIVSLNSLFAPGVVLQTGSLRRDILTHTASR